MHAARSLLTASILISALASPNVRAQAPSIVENPRPAPESNESLRLGLTPALVIGTQSGEMHEFYRRR